MKKIAFVFALLFSTHALGQEASTELAAAGQNLVSSIVTVIAMLLNAGGVYWLVGIVNKYRPDIKKAVPWLLPILAVIMGPLLNFVASLIMSAAGIVVDFTPLIDAFAGALSFEFSPMIGAFAGPAAVAFHQIKRQRTKGAPIGKLQA